MYSATIGALTIKQRIGLFRQPHLHDAPDDDVMGFPQQRGCKAALEDRGGPGQHRLTAGPWLPRRAVEPGGMFFAAAALSLLFDRRRAKRSAAILPPEAIA